MRIPKQRLLKKFRSKAVAGAVVALVAAVGGSLLLISHAATPYSNGYAASGTTAGITSTITGGSSPSGNAVQFGSTAATGYVSASGTNLMLNGKVTQFIGFDAYGMEGCFNGTSWTTAQLDAYFAGLPSNGLTRIWADQFWGTAVIANIVAQATKYNQHLVLSIANDDGNCDPTPDDPTEATCSNNPCGEPLSFYQGAGVAGSAWSTTYVGWVNTIVPMFANDPAVAMWEISNEPGQATAVPEATMQTYLGDSAKAIRAVDPNQLIEDGVNYNGNLGGGEANFQAAQSSPYINVLSFHDYIWDYYDSTNGSAYATANPENGQEFEFAQQAAAALNKPFIVGEAGVESGPSCTADLTQTQRTSYLKAKANDYFSGVNVSGTKGVPASAIMFWEYEPVNTFGWSNGQCEYDFYAGDPLVSMVQNYTVPN